MSKNQCISIGTRNQLTFMILHSSRSSKKNFLNSRQSKMLSLLLFSETPSQLIISHLLVISLVLLQLLDSSRKEALKREISTLMGQGEAMTSLWPEEPLPILECLTR